MKSLMTVAALVLPLPGGAEEQTREADTFRVLDDFLLAFNHDDRDAMAAACHFPHLRIDGTSVSLWRTAEEYRTSDAPGDFRPSPAANGRYRSARESREVLHSSAGQVHIAARAIRYRADNSVIGAEESLWIVTKREGRWGIQAQSIIAPKEDAGAEASAQPPPAGTDDPAAARARPAGTDASAAAEEDGADREAPCGWFDWGTLENRFPPTPEGATMTKARRKKGAIKPAHSNVNHRIHGAWTVEVVVDEKGKVRDVRITATPRIEPPWPAYDEAITKSIRQWTFEPANVDGRPRPDCATITIVDQ